MKPTKIIDSFRAAVGLGSARVASPDQNVQPTDFTSPGGTTPFATPGKPAGVNPLAAMAPAAAPALPPVVTPMAPPPAAATAAPPTSAPAVPSRNDPATSAKMDEAALAARKSAAPAKTLFTDGGYRGVGDEGSRELDGGGKKKRARTLYS